MANTSEFEKSDSFTTRMESFAHIPDISFTDIFKHHDRKHVISYGLFLGGAAAVFATRNKLPELIKVVKGSVAVAEEVGAEAKNGDLIERLRAVKHFIFDLDRTLVDTSKAVPALREAMHNQLVQETGLSHEFIAGAMDHTEERLASPYYWNRLDLIEPLQEVFPGVDLNKRFPSVAKVSQAAFYEALKPSPETIELLDTLRSQGKPIHVFTAGSPARTLEKLHGAGLTQYFDQIFTVGQNAFEDSSGSGLLRPGKSGVAVVELPENRKTNGKGYDLLIRALDEAPHKLLMTGDHPIEDVAHAKRRGMLTAQAKWYRAVPPQKILPDLELVSPINLTTLLQKVTWH